ncbi:hypothetical protein VTN96DRAFT_2865 [Rasamsonia emersonii]|uniref:FAS1 domain-containing protein n=1 Tax=Rasamsonia emersonii (strain ATCC 16479 / CBS 393.64 / IMI 116815) TaxID=1408163 RepID=A0A0F4Z467_RASE3|nr:hypothetical protein T310_0641 [Rasamsonia emersonii CBS 393.64]KKA25324.1 hypothetical protein T310_0641 [Rasamsonia emersonii CBS 393.64]
MKFPLLLSASLAAAFVVPDEKILAALSEEPIPNAFQLQQQQHDVDQGSFPPSWYVTTVADGIWRFASQLRHEENRCPEAEYESEDPQEVTSHDEYEYGGNIDASIAEDVNLQGDETEFHHHHRPIDRNHRFLQKLRDELNDVLGHRKHRPLPPPRRPPHRPPPQRPPFDEPEDDMPHGGHQPNQTIYQFISESEHTRIFAKIIEEFDEVVDYLNSTKANYTVFVPVDAAFQKFKHHPKPTKEFVLKWLEYHVSPGLYTRRTFFSAQTVPTLLKEENNSFNPQRISTQVGLKGLTLNFHSHVIRSNIFATNGVIHALDDVLFLPFSAVDTIDIVPSLLSTLNLGLVKTGLVDFLGPDTPKSGGTLFAPTNHAFAKLGPKINGFLFSRLGQKYLKALLKYHIVANRTLFSDAYYGPKNESDFTVVNGQHVDLPTLLHGHHLSVDIRHFHRFAHFVVNKHTRVSVSNVPVKEGVIHLVSSVIIPPRKRDSDSQVVEDDLEDDLPIGAETHHEEEEEMTVEELIERLQPYVEEE